MLRSRTMLTATTGRLYYALQSCCDAFLSCSRFCSLALQPCWYRTRTVRSSFRRCCLVRVMFMSVRLCPVMCSALLSSMMSACFVLCSGFWGCCWVLRRTCCISARLVLHSTLDVCHVVPFLCRAIADVIPDVVQRDFVLCDVSCCVVLLPDVLCQCCWLSCSYGVVTVRW